MAQAGNFQCQGSVSGTALGRFGAAGSWLPSSPEAAGEVPPGDSALPVTAMRQGAGPRVARGVRREGAAAVRPGRRFGRTATRVRPARGRGEAGPPRPLPCVALPASGSRGRRRGLLRAGPGGCDARGAETRDGAGAGGRTMRPTEARAARVGQGGARVAECVCVRLSVNADSLQPIGRAPPARPALRRRPLAGLNTKAPARPALRVGSGVRARGKRKASATSRLGDLSVLSSSPAHARPAQGP